LDEEVFLTMVGKFDYAAVENMPIFEREHLVKEVSDIIKRRQEALKQK
jgi:hypothetical protein